MAKPQTDENAIDVALMKKLAAGDASALETLISRHQQLVFALAVRTMRSTESAEDIVQDVFVKLYQIADKYQPAAKFTTWLYRIVVNHCLDIMRRQKNKPVTMDVSTVSQDDRTGDSWLEKTEQAKQIRKVVQALPERQRVVVVLHRFQGLTHKEVSQSTGWSVSAIESLLNRAYKTLRQKLKSV